MSDPISRRAAIRMYCGEHCGCEPSECGLTYEKDGTEECGVVRFLKSVPSAERHGQWIDTDIVHVVTELIEGDYPEALLCSRCGFKHSFKSEYGYSPIWHYCPNCGARMVRE